MDLGLLDKRFGVESLRNFHTEFQMFLHEILKLLGPHRLPLPLVLYVVVMLNDLLTRFPIHLDHI